MPQSFDVDYILLCEYSTISNTNKVLLAGVFGGEANFTTAPKVWGPFSLVASLIPRAKNFDFKIQLVQPNKEPLIISKGTYKVDRDPDDAERCIFNFQVAGLPFKGDGIYVIEAYDGEQLVFSRLLHVNVGSIPKRTPPQISANLEVKEKK